MTDKTREAIKGMMAELGASRYKKSNGYIKFCICQRRRGTLPFYKRGNRIHQIHSPG